MSFFLAAIAVATVASIGGTAIYGVTNSMAREPSHVHVGPDALQGNPYESAVGELSLNNGSAITSCTVSMVGPSGQALTAVHCFQEPEPCDFDTSAAEYALTSAEIFVDVPSVNGTGEKWTFPGIVLGWSGALDVMVIQLAPLVKWDGSVITLTTQSYLRWGSNRALERAEDVRSLSFDQAMLKKQGHRGSVLHPYADRGSSFSVSTEQVFADLNAAQGASGSAVLNGQMQIIMAPLTYGWTDNGGTNIDSISGTSADVSGPLVQAILAGASPNGPVGTRKFLVPSLGIVPQWTMSGINMQTWLNPSYFPMFENKGIMFEWLVQQSWFEFLTQVIMDCGFPPYNITTSSMEEAPLYETFAGDPPPLFPLFPGYGEGTIVVLLALQRAGQWVYVGDDTGLETISGIIATSGLWVGDSVLVRVKSGNPYVTDDMEANWEASYNVTLNAIDPFWDTIAMEPWMQLAAFIRVNQTQGAPTLLHYDSSYTMRPQLLTKVRHTGHSTQRKPQRAKAITEAPPGVDVGVLPTLSDLYRAHVKRPKQERKKPTAVK